MEKEQNSKSEGEKNKKSEPLEDSSKEKEINPDISTDNWDFNNYPWINWYFLF